MRFSLLFIPLLFSLAHPSFGQAPAPAARDEISAFEKAIAAQFAEKLAPSAARHRVEISSRDVKIKQPGTLVDLQKGWVVTSGDFTVNGAQTAFVKQGEAPIRVGKILIYSKEDHLLLLKITPAPEAAPTVPAKPETGRFTGSYSDTGALKIGNISSGIRAESTVFSASQNNALIKHWKRLNLKVSERRTKLASVFETDLDLDADDCGGPVFSRNGDLLGVLISRSGHHSALVVPVSRITELFEAK